MPSPNQFNIDLYQNDLDQAHKVIIFALAMNAPINTLLGFGLAFGVD